MKEENNISPENEIDDGALRMPEESIVGTHHNHLGPILGTLIVVLVLILGGLYLWGSMIDNNAGIDSTITPIENNEPETTRAETDAQILQTTSSSDEISAIEADLNSTNLDNLDADLQQAENEINATP